jgi:hypothetical protein
MNSFRFVSILLNQSNNKRPTKPCQIQNLTKSVIPNFSTCPQDTSSPKCRGSAWKQKIVLEWYFHQNQTKLEKSTSKPRGRQEVGEATLIQRWQFLTMFSWTPVLMAYSSTLPKFQKKRFFLSWDFFHFLRHNFPISSKNGKFYSKVELFSHFFLAII